VLGVMNMVFEPSAESCLFTSFWKPSPIEMSATTEAMPMTMPKIVRPDLALFAEREIYVSLNRSESIMIYCL